MINVVDFGAVADGKTLNTKAIQAAIDECAKTGGRVIVPTGTFVTGSIFLKSNVELHLTHGAVLKASGNLEDYNETSAYEQNSDCLGEEWLGKHLIMAIECQNVALTGSGTIDGNAEVYYAEPKYYSEYYWRFGLALAKDKEKLRPGQLVCFVECQNVIVEDVTMRNATCWSCFFHGCEYVRARGLRITNPKYAANTDGIDIDCCRYVTVSDCIINTGDDAIAIRCSSKRLKHKQACEFVTITGCVLSSASNAFRIGVGYGEIRHVRVSDIVIEKSACAMGFSTTFDGNGEAFIQDVNFSNVSAADTCYPMSIYAFNGCVKRITIDNCRIEGYCVSNIMGVPGVMKDIKIKDTDFYINKDPRGLNEKRKSDRGNDVFYANNVENLVFDNVNFITEAPDEWGNILRHDNCENLQIKN